MHSKGQKKLLQVEKLEKSTIFKDFLTAKYKEPINRILVKKNIICFYPN